MHGTGPAAVNLLSVGRRVSNDATSLTMRHLCVCVFVCVVSQPPLPLLVPPHSYPHYHCHAAVVLMARKNASAHLLAALRV